MKPYKILVAEDDAALRNSICTRLGSEGYAVLCAQDGHQAVAIAREQHPDMLILDVNMPAGDGFRGRIHEWSLAHLRHIPIACISGAREAGSLLTKYFDTDALLQLVRDALPQTGTHEESLHAGQHRSARVRLSRPRSARVNRANAAKARSVARRNAHNLANEFETSAVYSPSDELS